MMFQLLSFVLLSMSFYPVFKEQVMKIYVVFS